MPSDEPGFARFSFGGEILAVDDENNFSDCLTNSKEIVHNLASALLTTNQRCDEAKRKAKSLRRRVASMFFKNLQPISVGVWTSDLRRLNR